MAHHRQTNRSGENPMNTSSLPLAALRTAIESPKDGCVGIVDDVLALCRHHSLHLDWRDNRCRITSVSGDGEGELDVPLRKSIFRAIIARVATLCAERVPGSFAPYGGTGELLIGPEPAMLFRAVWGNTLADQHLTLMPALVNEHVGASGQDEANTAHSLTSPASCTPPLPSASSRSPHR